jgi:hypothetical protein
MLKLALATAAVALLAGSANAATVDFYSFGAGAPTYSLISDFSHDTVGLSPTDAGFSGNAVVLNSTSGNGAEPAIALNTYGTGNYLSVEAGQSETLTFGSAVKDVSLYIGSVDGYNGLNFTFGGAIAPISYTGATLPNGADNGAQTQADTNGMFVFHFADPVKTLTLTSSSNSFEIASISAGGVPEPASWALMMAGLGLVGGTLRVRNKQQAVAA